MLVLAMSLVSALLLPAAARADTTIGFDDLAVGTTVTNQYAAQGLRLGSSGDFGELHLQASATAAPLRWPHA